MRECVFLSFINIYHKIKEMLIEGVNNSSGRSDDNSHTLFLYHNRKIFAFFVLFALVCLGQLVGFFHLTFLRFFVICIASLSDF